MNQFKKPLAMLLALVMLCGAFLSDGKLAFAEGDPIIDVTEGEKPDGTPVANVLEAGNPAGDPTPEPTQEPAPEYTVTFVVGEGKFPVTVAENADAAVPEAANAAITDYEAANKQVFIGWDKGYTSIVADTEVTAQFAAATAPLTIHYKDTDGNQLRASYEAVFAIGAPYSVDSPEIQGYVVESGKETVSGTMAAGGVAVTVTYSVTDASYTVQHWVEQIDGSFIMKDEETISNAQTGTTVTAVAKSYEGCTAPDPMPSAMVAAEGTVIAVYYTRNTYTVSFETNGGSYVSSIFDVKHGATVTEPAAPTFAGYTFAGWLNGETAFDFNTPVTGNLTLTAKWEPKLVNYTVVYWQENADDDGYSYVETATKQGYAGSEATFDEKDYAHFVVSENSDYKLISGDGSTILNVYYDREEYTLTFVTGNSYRPTCGKQEHTHSWRCYEWVLVCENDSFWHRHNESCYERRLTCGLEEHTHSSACYASGVVATITAKYGAYIADEFNKAPFNTTYNGRAWEDTGNTYGYALQTLDRMPGTNVTFRLYDKSSNKLKTIYYWVESLPGVTPDKIEGGIGYTLLKTVDTYFNYMTYEEEYHPIEGFIRQSASAAGFNRSQKNFDKNNEGHLYYTRESYNVQYYNVTGVVHTASAKYQQSLAGYGAYTPNRPEGIDESFVFSGWYKDEACTTAFDFANATMPAGNIVVYAKWVAPVFTATFEYQVMIGGETHTVQADIPYGSTISAPVVTHPEGYPLEGWYTDAAYANRFDFSTPITKDITLYAKWHTTQTYGYTVKYVDAIGTEIAEAESFTGTPNTTVIAQAKKIDGYELNDAQSKSVLLDADNKEIVFKYRYIGTYSYTVQYLLEGTTTKVSPDKVVPNVSSRIVTENAKYVNGYVLISDTPQTITLSSDASENVIKFYYRALGEEIMIRYWVKHVIDNGDGTTTLRAIEMKSETVAKGQSVTVVEKDVEKKTFEGYKYDRAVTLPSTFTDNSSSNSITLYYVKDETQTRTLSYTVEHYLDNALQTADTVTVEKEVWVLDPATTLTVTPASVAHKSYTNAEFTHSDPAAIPGTIQNGGVIKLYYVTKTAITITAKSGSMTYDGTALENGGYDLTGTLKAGDTLDVTVSGSVTNVADNKADNNVITSVKVLRNGIDVTAQYTITKVPGTLTINQRPVTFTGETATKPYTGSEQKITGITPDGLLSGHTYTGLTYSAKGTNVGGYDGTFSGTVKIMDGTVDVTENYAVTKTPGKLTITKASIPVTFTGESDSRTYTGSDIELTGITPTGLLEGHTYTGLTYSAKGTNVGGYDGTFSGTVKIMDGTVDVTENYAVTKTPGKLTITKASIPVTFTGESDSRTYTGSDIELTGITPTGLLEGHTYTGLTYSAKGKNVGGYDGTFSGTVKIMDGTVDVTENYAVTKTPGKLTITKASIPVTFTGESDSRTYTGSDIELTGITPTGLLEGHTYTGLTYSAKGKNVGGYDGTFSGTVKIMDGTVDVTENYAVTKTPGKLTITKASIPVTFTGESDSRTYTGSDIELTGITPTGLLEGHTYTGLTYSAKGKNVGGYDGAFSGTVKIMDGTVDVTENYAVTKTPGKLTINPIGTPIVITADSNEKEYDGTALTDSGYTYTNGVLVSGDVLTAVVEGSQTEVGSGANKVASYKVMRGDKDVTANYTFGTSVDGVLKVNPRAVTITVSDASKLFGTVDPIFTGSITKGELVNEGDLGAIEYYRINAGVEAVGTYNAALSAKFKENGNYVVTVVNGTFTIYLPEPEPIIPTPTPDIPLDVPQTGDGAMLHTIIGFACIAMAGLLGKLRRKENEGEA